MVAALMVVSAALLVAVEPPLAESAASSAWTIKTAAGGGSPVDGVGDGGLATQAALSGPAGVADDGAGNLYIADAANHRVRKVDSTGNITTVAGVGASGFSGDGGPAIVAQLNYPTDVAVDGGGLYIADRYNHRIRRVDAAGMISTVAGISPAGPPNGGFSGDLGPALLAQLSQPVGVSFDGAHNLYVADSGNSRVRKVTPGANAMVDGGIDDFIATVAGGGSPPDQIGDGGPATSAALTPDDVATAADGSLYIGDANGGRIRKVTAGADGAIDGDADDIITTAAGTGERAFGGDGGPATSAALFFPMGVAVDAGGNLFIADTYNGRIRRVDASGRITTVAGTGERGFRGDGGPSISAALHRPYKLHLDAFGNLFIADIVNKRVRRVDTALSWMEDSPDPGKVGEAFSYTVHVGGLATATSGVQVKAVLAPQVSFRSATPSQGACSQTKGVVTCGLGGLGKGRTASVRIEVKPTSPGILTSSATITPEQAAAMPYNNTISAQTRVSAVDCGRVLTRDTVLRKDIGPCGGNGIIVGADNVTLDLGAKRVFGFPGPVDGNSAGIRLPMRKNVTVKNGTVADFDAGVVLNGGEANTVSGLIVRDNVGPDNAFTAELGDGIILFNSKNNAIVKNQVLRNGIFDGIGVLGWFADGNHIEGNVVEDTIGPADRGPAGQGLIVNAAGLGSDNGQMIEGTQVLNNVVRRSGSAGLSNVNSINGSIEGNSVEGNGFTNRVGNGIGIQLGPAAVTTVTNMVVRFNQVHGNAWSGITIPGSHNAGFPSSPASGNHVLDNNAANNAKDPLAAQNGYFDLHDGNDCAGNTWLRNTWGSGGFSPPCTATDGSAELPQAQASSTSTTPAPDTDLMPTLRQLPPVPE